MVATLIARVDGLPVSLVAPERVWPAPTSPKRRKLSARERSRIDRRTAGVHECRLPAWARAVAGWEAEQERLEIRSELERAGLL